MSETEFKDFDTVEQIARINRSLEETRKFVAEQHKLMAEGDKLKRDRWLAPILALSSIGGGAVVALVNYFIK